MGPLLLAAIGLIRGAELPPEGWNATALVTIRQRLGMNAVRVAPAPGIADLVRVANRLELLVIVDSERPLALRGRVLYAVSTAQGLAAIRASGVAGPVIVRGFPTDDPEVIEEVTPRYADPASWHWDRRHPVLASGLDPEIAEGGAECAAFPPDPGAAAAFFSEKLREFDENGVSWTISSFRPGKLVTDWRYLIGTKLDDGWTCGERGGAGLGMLLLAHLRGADPHGLFAVNGDAGNYRLPIGGRATAYGPIMASREMIAAPGPLPARLANVSVRITDSRGVAHTAPLLYTGAGWAHIIFLVPSDAAPGPAEVAVVRTDGTRSTAKTLLARVAPGLLSASIDGRGVAKAWWSGGPAFRCDADCEALPVAAGAQVRFVGTGFRHAKSMRVMVGEREARIVSYGAIAEAGRDQLVIEMPDGSGDADVLLSADGVLSNVVRVAVTPSSASPRSRRTASATHRSRGGPSGRR
jgi:uncharacterized protein (TIGR03437 family)